VNVESISNCRSTGPKVNSWGSFGSDTRPALPLKDASMETGQTNEAKHAKGFVRRNWLSLTAVATLLFLSSQAMEVFIPTRWFVLAREGNIGLVVLDEEAAGWLSQRGKYGWVETRWAIPQFGGWVRMSSEDLFAGFAIPIWLPLASVTVWIAFREWRRKRVAKGKACPQ
jgi:hypothetical protein